MAKLRYYIPLLLLASAIPAVAQYDQDISVEGKYVPEIINHDRIGMFPRPVKFPLEKSTLQYSLTGVNADFTPLAVPIQATGWKSTRDFSARRGYLELGLGSWLESTLSAGYRFVDTRESAFGIRLQHNSTSLWKPDLGDRVDTRMSRYDESIGLYGHHTFGDKGRLDAAIDYHIGNFNYYGFDPALYVTGTQQGNGGIASDKYEAPTQTLNDVAARIAWHSPSGLDNISWNVGAGVRYFGYRRFYALSNRSEPASMTGGRETDININGAIVFPTSSKSALGIDLDADILSYGKTELKDGVPLGNMLLPELDSYGMVSLTPYYRFTRSRLNIRIGARIDLAFNAGPEDNRYSVFHIAPSIRLDYNAGPATLFLHALGGSTLNTLAAGYDLNYYQAPAIFSTAPVYTPLDARLGATFGPFAGFHAGFDVAFRMSRGQYFGGFYQCWLNDPFSDLGLPSQLDGRPVDYQLAPGSKSNLSGFSVGLDLGYDAGRYFKINARGRWQRQDGKTGYFNGYDRPEWTASVTAETNPWNTLKFRLGYELRALRMMPVEAHYADTTPLNSDLIVMYRLPNMSMLNFGASYGITENINVWIQADNLLNRKWQYMPGLQEPGIRLAAGVGICF